MGEGRADGLFHRSPQSGARHERRAAVLLRWSAGVFIGDGQGESREIPRVGEKSHYRAAGAERYAAHHRAFVSPVVAANQRSMGDGERESAHHGGVPGDFVEYATQYDGGLSYGGAATGTGDRGIFAAGETVGEVSK